MVKIDIKDYCNTCPYFEADVISPPALYYDSNNRAIPIDGDTIIKCQHREHCEFVMDQSEKQYTKLNSFLYRTPPVGSYWDEIFKKLEKALGFKLFVWQKSFIIEGDFRQYGKTTSEILRILLNDLDRPITRDDLNNLNTICGRHFEKELRNIKRKLDSAGIKTREINF